MEGAGEASEGAERAKEVAGGKGGGSVAAVEPQGELGSTQVLLRESAGKR